MAVSPVYCKDCTFFRYHASSGEAGFTDAAACLADVYADTRQTPTGVHTITYVANALSKNAHNDCPDFHQETRGVLARFLARRRDPSHGVTSMWHEYTRHTSEKARIRARDQGGPSLTRS